MPKKRVLNQIVDALHGYMQYQREPVSAEQLLEHFSKDAGIVELYSPQTFKPRFMTVLRRFGQRPDAALERHNLRVTLTTNETPVRQADCWLHPPEENMSQAITHTKPHTFEFEGKPITTITYKDRPVFIAKEIGERLGYSSEGSRLVDKITGEWAEELIEKQDFVVLRGQELSDFKQLLKVTQDSGGAFNALLYAPQLMLLFETGINAITMLSRKPEARRLRRYLIEEVLPQLHRTGAYTPELTVTPQGELVASADTNAIMPVNDHIALLAAQAEYNLSLVALKDAETRSERVKVMGINAETRQSAQTFKITKYKTEREAKGLRDAAELGLGRGTITPEQATAILSSAVSVESGIKIPQAGLYATTVGQKYGMTAKRVGLLVKRLDLRDNRSKAAKTSYMLDPLYSVPTNHDLPQTGKQRYTHKLGYKLLPPLVDLVVGLAEELGHIGEYNWAEAGVKKAAAEARKDTTH